MTSSKITWSMAANGTAIRAPAAPRRTVPESTARIVSKGSMLRAWPSTRGPSTYAFTSSMTYDARKVSPNVAQPWNAAMISRHACDPHADLRDQLAEGDDHRERHRERHPEQSQADVHEDADDDHDDELCPQVSAEPGPDRLHDGSRLLAPRWARQEEHVFEQSLAAHHEQRRKDVDHAQVDSSLAAVRGRFTSCPPTSPASRPPRLSIWDSNVPAPGYWRLTAAYSWLRCWNRVT